MKSQDVNALLSPAKFMVERHALSPTYRAIELSPKLVRSFAKHALLEITADLGITNTVIVDSSAFLAVITSLPANEDLELTVDAGSLAWKCGAARGKLATMAADLPAPISRRVRFNTGISPSKEFIRAMRLGSLSADSAALDAVNMYGVLVNTYGQSGVIFSSTDNISISSCFAADPMPDIDGSTYTIPPEGAELMASIMDTNGTLEMTSDSWFYQSATFRCFMRYKAMISSDIQSILAQYGSSDVTAPIPRARIEAFIARASALTENRRNTVVGLSATSGQLSLTFKEGMSTAEEFFLIDVLDGLPDMPEIQLSALEAARALSNITEVVLDYMERGIVILHNPEIGFSYLLSGSLPT